MTKPLCGAKRRQGDGATCKKRAGWGTSHPGVGHCRDHGGASPGGIKAAARLATTQEARAMLERLGEPDAVDDPVQALLDVAAEARAWLGVLRELVAKHSDLATTDVLNVERERAAVRLYGEAMDRTALILTSIVKLNLDERRTRISELHGAVLLAAVQKMLAHPDLGLDVAHRQRAELLLKAELDRSPGPIAPQAMSAASHDPLPVRAGRAGAGKSLRAKGKT